MNIHQIPTNPFVISIWLTTTKTFFFFSFFFENFNRTIGVMVLTNRNKEVFILTTWFIFITTRFNVKPFENNLNQDSIMTRY